MFNSRFDVKNMRLNGVILESKISMISNSLIRSQCHYIDKILKKFNNGDCGVVRTPVRILYELYKTDNSLRCK